MPQVKISTERQIKVRKAFGQRWSFDFDDEVTMRDITILQRTLRVEYLRSRRRKRMRLKAQSTTAPVPPVKEAANVAA